MTSKIFFVFIFCAFFSKLSFAQCTYPTGNTVTGAVQTHCINTPGASITFTSLKSTQFILQNVVQGFTYSFTVGDVYSGATENINIYDAATNTNLANNSGGAGAAISSWTATFSGQIKIIVSKNACDHSDLTPVNVILGLISIGNTFDSESNFGTNTWVGHIYNFTTVAPPGGTSPSTPVAAEPFLSSNYAGYYDINSETINEGFGTGGGCFPVRSNGIIAANISTETFAVRYKMKSTRPAGCYMITCTGDDGIRLYNDGVIVFSQWQTQAPTAYSNILVYLDGDANLVFDYFENGGGNSVGISITPFLSTTNFLLPTNGLSVCTGVAPGTIVGSTFVYNNGAVNPTLGFQWQVSNDNISWTDIAGATSKDYAPPTLTTSGTAIIKYYRRVVFSVSNSSSCRFNSNSIIVTTSDPSSLAAIPVAVAATNESCFSFAANWNSVPTATSYAIDVSTNNTFSSFVGIYNNFNVGLVTTFTPFVPSGPIIYYYRIRAVNGCGSTTNSNVVSANVVTNTLPTTNTVIGSPQTLCVQLPASTQIFSGLTSNKFILQNVVQGFTYSFGVGDVFAGATESISIYDNATNNILAGNIGNVGSSVINWTAPFSGQIKIIVTKNGCDTTDPASFPVTLDIVNVGNTLDSQITFGTDTWVGHVYNYAGGAGPGGASPASLATTTPFSPAEYVGNYVVNSETINQGFGGDTVCFPVFSGGTVRTNIETTAFAVRYRMNSTRPAGCYIFTVRGDDGIRIYNENALVFSQWQDQGITTYTNILLYLDGSANLVYDFYENNGLNGTELNIAPFNPTANTVTAPAIASVCSGTSPASINGSAFLYSGAAINPTIKFQWQISTDDITWANIAGATTEDYIPAAITTSGSNIIRYYRRVIAAASNAAACTYNSNSIAITTTHPDIASAIAVANAGTSSGCNTFTANWNVVAEATSYTIDVSTDDTFSSFVATYKNLNIGGVTSVNITGLVPNTIYYYRVRGVNSCGNSISSNVIQVNTFTVNPPVANAAQILNCDVFAISWNAPTNATSYLLSISTDPSFTTFLPGYNNLNIGNINSTTISGFSSGPFYYRISAVGVCGSSNNSNTITVPITSSTWNGSAWSNGIPDLTKTAFITGDYDLSVYPNINACAVVVASPARVIISANKTVQIQNNLTVNSGANFEVLDNGALVQINDLGINTVVSPTINTGFSIQRKANVRRDDYVFWSTPVSSFMLSQVSPSSTPGMIIGWNATSPNPNGGQGNWIGASGSMGIGRGYAIKAPNILPFNNSNANALTTSFKGTPNNGVYNIPIQRGSNFIGTGSQGILRTYDDDNWNLIGNPYPSAINAVAFLTANPAIEGAVHIWTHGQLPSANASQPFYSYYALNYDANDYIVHNGTGTTSGPGGFGGNIASGQGFFVKMLDGASPATANVVFRNNMRNVTYANNQFYRQNTDSTITQNRIWLDLKNSQDSTLSRTLIGYVTGASNDRDRIFDASGDYQASNSLFSLIDQNPMFIQGRSLPFDSQDIVDLGFLVANATNYKIAVAATDGLFSQSNQQIFLQDTETNTIHNLTTAPYSFSSNAGINKSRFKIRYNSGLLSTPANAKANDILVYKQNESLMIMSNNDLIQSVAVYDVLGRSLYDDKNINNTYITISNIALQQQTLLVKITLKNDTIVTKKIMF